MNWFKSYWKALKEAHASGKPAAKPAESVSPGVERLSRVGQSSHEYLNNFTPRAQQVLALARREADRFNHNFVGTEHLLLGMIRLGQGTAVAVFLKMGLNLDAVRSEVEKQVGTGPDQKMIGNIPYTPRVKKVLALAAKEAKSLNHTYVGTEHILLGLLREGDGIAARVLRSLDVDIEQTRQEILKELDPNYPGTTADKNPPERQKNMDTANPSLPAIDTTKRYDVYCVERNQQATVYRNARFKSRSRLLGTRQHDFGGEFLELEQSNGQVVYLSLHSVLKFCEHGGEIIGEIVPPK